MEALRERAAVGESEAEVVGEAGRVVRVPAVAEYQSGFRLRSTALAREHVGEFAAPGVLDAAARGRRAGSARTARASARAGGEPEPVLLRHLEVALEASIWSRSWRPAGVGALRRWKKVQASPPARMAERPPPRRIGQDPVTASRRPTKPTTVPNRTRRTSRLPRPRQPGRATSAGCRRAAGRRAPRRPRPRTGRADDVLVADLVAEQEQGADHDQDREAGAGGEPGRVDAEDRAADLQVQRLEERLARAADPLVVGLLEVERVVAGEKAPLQA